MSDVTAPVGCQLRDACT